MGYKVATKEREKRKGKTKNTPTLNPSPTNHGDLLKYKHFFINRLYQENKQHKNKIFFEKTIVSKYFLFLSLKTT